MFVRSVYEHERCVYGVFMKKCVYSPLTQTEIIAFAGASNSRYVFMVCLFVLHCVYAVFIEGVF